MNDFGEIRKRTILVLDHFYPLHDRNSGSLRLYQILRSLLDDGHRLVYAALEVREGQEHYGDELRSLGVEVTNAGIGTLDELALARRLQRGDIDEVQISFYMLAAQFLPLIRRTAPKARVIIDTIDLHFVREKRQAELHGDQIGEARSLQTKRNEVNAYAQADALIAITDVERDLLLAELPRATVYTVPNIHEVPPDRGFPYGQRQGLLFAGNFWHPPNVEGIVWFCADVLPIVREHLATVALNVVGQNPPVTKVFDQPGVNVLGWVPSLEPLLQSSRLSIAPLLHGAGMKGKVGEALANGLPVVTTSIGAEGMGLVSGQHALIEDTAERFAASVVEAYQNPELWTNLATNGRQLVESRWSPVAVRTQIRQVYPPSSTASVAFFALPHWDDAEGTKALLDDYIVHFEGQTKCSLALGIVDDHTTPEAAYASIVKWLGELGHDPETIPDLAIDPMTASDVAALDQSVIRIGPMLSAIR